MATAIRTIPDDFEDRVTAILGHTLANVPPDLGQHLKQAVNEVLTYADMPVIPDHLLVYDESRYIDQVGPTVRFRGLRSAELWRQDQDAWGHTHGVDRARFEQLRDRQLAARQQQENA
ncbi:hypothetical protein [Nonomuraea cavernae]|uniref:Uncharacterized protein n=1 Tax=Nonomuraea cavernae TaxID=2045107 RepID=A0A917YZD7_9ACTN|nr:hypothetical protein [Nonomuraea cavernae]MCA2187736.1 hypothetical protein [Nonomuraea cavernae]GGO70655.1 hypothetical protein GCM10012289_34560 [Nonomuraea cavernae]